MAGVDNLTPWEPGQTGNPRGDSNKSRRRRLLKDFIALEINKGLPDADAQILLDQLADLGVSEEDARSSLDGITNGQVIAARIVAEARGTGRDAPKARDQIISTEPKTLEVEPLDLPRSPEFIPSSEDEDAFEQAARDRGMIH